MDKTSSLEKSYGFGNLMTAIHSVSNKFSDTLFYNTGTYSVKKLSPKDNADAKLFIQKELVKRGGIGLDHLYYDEELLDLHSSYGAKGKFFWILKFEGEIVGTLGLVIHSDKREAVINKFYVKNDIKDHAQSLIKIALSMAKKSGCRACNISLSQREEQLQKLFEKASFKISDRSLMMAMTFFF
ncbi:GNAT family N-acetyltransferase [Ekhidna sp.]|uniref:GNAT family N-acetyltransferase n=1 Tax=Ekhidna sp. TaxID=2608089 RepID=UPI003B51158A